MASHHRITFEVRGPQASQIESAVKQAHAEGMQRLRDEVERAFMRHARVKLDTTKDKYIDAMEVTADQESVTVDIQGWLPVALEQGAPSFDMKPGLLDGRDSRVIPMHDGEFRTVSKRSPPDSWHHPGFEPRAIHEEVEAQADELVQKAFEGPFSRIKI